MSRKAASRRWLRKPRRRLSRNPRPAASPRWLRKRDAAVSKPATSGIASLVEEGRSPVSKPAARSSDSWCRASSPTAAARRASRLSADPSAFRFSAPRVTAAPKARASARSSSAVIRMVPEKETRFSSIVTCRPTAAARASAARAGSYDAAATTWATGAAAPTPARSGASPTPSTCPAPHRPFETGLSGRSSGQRLRDAPRVPDPPGVTNAAASEAGDAGCWSAHEQAAANRSAS